MTDVPERTDEPGRSDALQDADRTVRHPAQRRRVPDDECRRRRGP